jgi:hypothetical protein
MNQKRTEEVMNAVMKLMNELKTTDDEVQDVGNYLLNAHLYDGSEEDDECDCTDLDAASGCECPQCEQMRDDMYLECTAGDDGGCTCPKCRLMSTAEPAVTDGELQRMPMKTRRIQ